MNKKWFVLTLLYMPLCIASQSSSATPTPEKKFNQVKKDYAAPKAEIKDITITDAADAGFFEGKTLENVTFNAAVTGGWKNVTLMGTITFTSLPTKGTADTAEPIVAIVDEKTMKNRTANLVRKDGKAIVIKKTGDKIQFALSS